MDDDLAELLERLELNVTQAVARFRATDPNPDDPYRGLYVSDDHVDAMLHHGRRWIDTRRPSVTAGGRVEQLMVEFGLDRSEIEIIVAALAPDLDPRFERLYGYLHDDLSRRRVSVGLALQLAGLETLDSRDRASLLPGSALITNALVVIEERDRPVLTRSVRVPDRVGQFLLGSDEPDEQLLDLLVRPVAWPGDEPRAVGKALVSSDRFVYVRDPSGANGLDLGAAGLRTIGVDAVAVDLGRSTSDRVIEPERLSREARLLGAGLVVAGIDRAAPDVTRAIISTAPALVLVGPGPWDPGLADRVPMTVEVVAPVVETRRRLWSNAIASLHAPTGHAEPPDPADLDSLRLGPRAVSRAVRDAQVQAAVAGESIRLSHLSSGARNQNSPGLERLARRIQPEANWDDLIVRSATADGLRELAARVRHRSTVFETWKLQRSGGRGEGITALFTGGSGTGKTLAAEVIASALALDLYVIDLSTVVDKYVGETEKNLDRVFTEAEGVSAILFFDEADALFGKRSDVSDARDRYANLEVSYLLQRMEQFDGLAILASNLRGNLDDAFLRRLSMVIDFADPDMHLRKRLWDRQLRSLPLDAGVDSTHLATEYELTGGNIRSATVTAAVRAADRGSTVAMDDLVTAIRHEYRKLGRLI